MGSYDHAVMTGFICRLCSELNSNVVHIYSEKGIKLQLAEKINLMPISVEPQDNLPKTICFSCVHQLDNQYRLIQQLRNSRDKILAHARMRVRMHEERERHNNNQNGTTSQSSSESSENGSEHPENRIDNISQNNEQSNTETSNNCVQEQGENQVASDMDVSDGNNNSSP